jgi:hypothetical protein
MAGMATTLTTFYSWARRKRSPERDLGLYWRDGVSGPTYRAAWVQSTGELITVRHGAINDGGGVVEILAVLPDPRDLEDALDGWEQVCGEPDSIAWLRARAALWPFATAA